MTMPTYVNSRSADLEHKGLAIKNSSVADTKKLQEAKKLLLEVYNLATEEPYNFFNLRNPDVNDMFYKRFDAKLVIDEYICIYSV